MSNQESLCKLSYLALSEHAVTHSASAVRCLEEMRLREELAGNHEMAEVMRSCRDSVNGTTRLCNVLARLKSRDAMEKLNGLPRENV